MHAYERGTCRMRRRSLFQGAAVLAAAGLIVTGCGGGSSKGGGGGDNNKNNSGFNAGSNAIRNPSTAKGGTLNLIASSDCDYYDPARTYFGHCWDMLRLFPRGLMGYKAEPGDAGLQVVPDLAQAKGETTDGKTYTYKLKPGLKYQDGTAITSKDVKYGIERTFAQDIINGGPTYVITFLCPTKLNASGGC